MAQPLRVEQLDQSLRALGRIEAQHALQLRRMIYGDGGISQKDAEILFSLNDACSKKDPAFAQLFVEALTDYFVWQTSPKGYVTPEQARYLIGKVTADGHVESQTELALVLNVVHWARQCPEDLVALVIESVRQSVLLSRESALGANRPRVSIGAGDVAILRKALHAPAGDGGLLISRREAELLFTLNEATAAGENDKEWTDFFVHAIANHLMNPMDATVVPTIEDASRRDRWLDERNSIGNLLSGVAGALSRGDVPVRSVFEELDPFGAKAAKKEAAQEAMAAKIALARETIDADEAKWLVERIQRDGTIDENERALLKFLKKESPSIDPALQALFKKAGI